MKKRTTASKKVVRKSHAKSRPRSLSDSKVKVHIQKPAASHSKRVKAFLSNSAVSEFLLGLAGEHANSVLGSMDGAMSDEEIARTAKLKVSDVRSVLNKLHGQGIAVYERTRDKDTGWYYYKWSVNPSAMTDVVDERKRSERNEAARLAAEGAYSFYMCGKCSQEKYHFEMALDYLFKCPQCGSSLDYFDAKNAAAPQMPKK